MKLPLLLPAPSLIMIVLFFMMAAAPAESQEASEMSEQSNQNENEQSNDEVKNASEEFLKRIVGSWEGTCRTWFRPGELADESAVKGNIKPILNGHFFRHTYEGEIQGRPRHGEETITFNTVTKNYQVSWMDDFHMGYAILFSEGKRIEKGFSVSGKYDAGPGLPQWGWRTEYELIDDDHFTITAYNITPEGVEAKAVETKYHRAAPPG